MDSSQQKGSDIPRMIWIIGSPIIFTVGCLGNLMTLTVLSRTQYKKSSTSVFLMFLAAADLLVVTTLLPRWWIIYVFGIDIRHVNNALCKLHWFFTYYISSCSNTFLVAVTVERIISIIRPYKVKTWCTINTAVLTSVTIILALIPFHGHILFGLKLFNITEYHIETIRINNTIQSLENQLRFMNEISSTFDTNSQEVYDNNNSTSINLRRWSHFEHGNGTIKRLLNICNSTDLNVTFNFSNKVFLKNNKDYCELIQWSQKIVSMCWHDDPQYAEFYDNIFYVMHSFITHIIPEVSTLVGIIVIIRQVAVSRKLRRTMQTKITENMRRSKRKKSTFDNNLTQITRSLILINAVFLIFTTPVHIFLLGRPTWIDEDKGMTETQEIIWAVFNMMFYINNAINFIFYFLSGSRFRNQVKETLTMRCQKRETVTESSQSRYISDMYSISR